MDMLETIVYRRSIRSYKDIPIPRGILSDILTAGQHAPLAGNSQNLRFVVIDDEPLKKKIATACYAQNWMVTAPIFIVICSDVVKIEQLYPSNGQNFGTQNASAAAQNMILLAESQGVSSCWVADFKVKTVKDLLHIPDTYTPRIIIPFGYANEHVPKPAKADLYALTFLNGFGGPYAFSDTDWLFNDFSTSLQKKGSRAWDSFKNTLAVIKDSFKKKK